MVHGILWPGTSRNQGRSQSCHGMERFPEHVLFLGQFLPLGLKTDSKSGSYIDAVDMSRTNVCCQHVGVSTCFTRQHDITRLASRKMATG